MVYLIIKKWQRQPQRKGEITMLKIKITYKTGVVLEENINYLHIENGKIYYTVRRQAAPIFQEPVAIPLDVVETFDLEEVSA